jgi:predicted lipoprotein with Yx(FWY)xxD motif
MRCLELKAIAFSAAMALSSGVLAAGGGKAPSAPARVEMTDDGPILVTPAGITLYSFGGDDTTPGKSQCGSIPRRGIPDPTGGFGTLPLPRNDVQKSCIQKWPPYMADANAQASGEFGLLDRTEGGKQWTYLGHPLYTSVKDHKAGDRNAGWSIGQVGGGGRGWHLAMAPLDFPPGFKLIRQEEGLTLATSNSRPVYTPRGRRLQRTEDIFEPILAPAVASVGGDWSIVDAGAGRYQYAFKGKPLYAAPVGMTEGDITETGSWESVVFRKDAGTPSEIEKRFTLLGDVYTDKGGKTLYVFTCAAGGDVRCDDPGDAAMYWVMLCGEAKECARRWHPYLAPAKGRAVGEWSVVDVAYPMFTEPLGFTYPPEAPRVKAWAYRGMPVYTYHEDKRSGDIFGHGIRVFANSGFYAVQVPGRSAVD